ncbi:hypothetical protein FC694_09245 [Bacillus wiedmannii]|uniref:PA14 domain-containing protein n=1 Tax=Bacillus wiedmannii TaxID=1890302 RepID=A0A4U2N2X2_9BACI|nr:binary toxin-like calcium binding domain-containing protein [Bacillus wiedmannii]TKH17348.1 hypothetical protein FC694_09245 [Bacillus wiedmannii]
MKTNNLYKCLATSVLFSTLMVPNTSHAKMQDSDMNKTQSTQQEKNKNTSQGLMGYYYNDNNFKKPALIAPEINGDLKIEKNEVKDLLSADKQNFESVRWIGYIKPSKTDEYLFSTSTDEEIIMEIDGNVVIDKGSMKDKIKLEQDKSYKVKIEYKPQIKSTSSNLVEMKLFWEGSLTEKSLIPAENLILPDFSKTENKESFIPKESLFESSNTKRSKRSLTVTEDEFKDSDSDSIYDSWEQNGYTVQNKMAVKWDDSMKEKGYQKFVSNPYESHTVGDPYTDYQKAAGDMDRGVKAEARNPLVAAYPVIGVGMEKLIVSEFNEVTKETGKSTSTATSNSKTEENTAGIEATVGFEGLKFNGQVTTSFSHTSSNTTSVENASEKNWSEAINLNQGESAALNANIRYYNTGTAPIYDAQPTTNLILGKDTLHTIKIKQDQIANTIAPGQSFPNQGQGPIALNKLDEQGSNIFINYDQLSKLQSGTKLKLETTQTNGLYGIKNSDGSIKKDSSQEWGPIINQIENSSANIILDTGNETLERRVAAKNYNDPEDKTPEITIGEAVKIAFGCSEENGKILYQDMTLNESAVGLVYDKETEREIKNQLDQMESKNVYDAKLKRGMNILITKPVVYSSVDKGDKNGWISSSKLTRVSNGLTGNALKLEGGELANIRFKSMKPNTTYTLSAYAKVDSPNISDKQKVYLQPFAMTSDFNNVKEAPKTELEIDGSKYQRIELTFKISKYPERFSALNIGNNGKDPILFDDVTLVEWKTDKQEEVAPSHQIRGWWTDPSQSDGTYINGIFFSKVPKSPVYQYKLVVNGKDYGTRNRYNLESDGSLKINFLDYNLGRGFKETDSIRVYAVDPVSHKEYLVASKN